MRGEVLSTLLKQLKQSIREEYNRGDIFPSVRGISKTYNVSTKTVAKFLDISTISISVR